jgi:hypothetical protein
MSDRYDIKSNSMGPSVIAVYKISRGCDKLTNFGGELVSVFRAGLLEQCWALKKRFILVMNFGLLVWRWYEGKRY